MIEASNAFGRFFKGQVSATAKHALVARVATALVGHVAQLAAHESASSILLATR